jgi:uncharacterized SAM-binding protein YcdF (DUF218 family)
MVILLQRAALAFAIFFAVISLTPVESWWISDLESAWNDEPPPVLLVLGGDEQAAGVIGYSTYLRLQYTAKFWHAGHVRKIVLSGAGSGSPPLAEAMRDYMLGQGVPAEAMLLESASRDTFENIRNSKALLEPLGGPFGLVTSDYHSGRAHAIARKAGLEMVPLPIPDAQKRWSTWSERWPLFWLLSAEAGKRAWYRWQGWV